MVFSLNCSYLGVVDFLKGFLETFVGGVGVIKFLGKTASFLASAASKGLEDGGSMSISLSSYFFQK